MATAAKTKRTRKAKSAAKAGRRIFRFDRKLNGMVEVTMRYDAKLEKMVEVAVPVKDEKKSDAAWLRPRQLPANAKKVSLWPMVSNQAAINPKQIPAMQRLLQRKGVKVTDFDGFGRPTFTDKRHKREYLRATGRADFDASFGDAAPLYFRGDPNRE